MHDLASSSDLEGSPDSNIWQTTVVVLQKVLRHQDLLEPRLLDLEDSIWDIYYYFWNDTLTTRSHLLHRPSVG